LKDAFAPQPRLAFHELPTGPTTSEIAQMMNTRSTISKKIRWTLSGIGHWNAAAIHWT
jgi:hypothetical protein